MPELQSLHLENVEAFDQNNFMAVCQKLSMYQGLEKLVLELLVFDLEQVKEKYVEVVRHH